MFHLRLFGAMLVIGLLSFFAIDTIRADCGERSCCLCGKKVCTLNVKKEKEQVTRFEVEAKEICIPAIRLPWQKCGPRRCGKTRTVCVLKEIKKDKTVCRYDWSVKTICTTCCQRRGLRHSTECAQVQRDERIPFEYYTAPQVVDVPKQGHSAVRQSNAQSVVRPVVRMRLLDRTSSGSRPVSYSITD